MSAQARLDLNALTDIASTKTTSAGAQTEEEELTLVVYVNKLDVPPIAYQHIKELIDVDVLSQVQITSRKLTISHTSRISTSQSARVSNCDSAQDKTDYVTCTVEECS